MHSQVKCYKSLCPHLGIYIINLKRTWEKLLLAARAIVAIENPADVSVISSRNTGQVCGTVVIFYIIKIKLTDIVRHLERHKKTEITQAGRSGYACNPSTLGGGVRHITRSGDPHHGEAPSLLKIQKISWAWGRVPVVPATREGGEWREPGGRSLQ